MSTQREICGTCGEICIVSETSDYNSDYLGREINGKIMCHGCRQKLKRELE